MRQTYLHEVLELFIGNCSLVEAMKHSDHGYGDKLNPYHLEGSVFTHTMMVYKEATTRYPEDNLLHIACLLHDIGKVQAREVVEDEVKGTRVRFFGHEGLSTFQAIDILNSEAFNTLELTNEDKVLILNTIALHGDFFDSFKDEKSITKMLNKYNCDERRLFELVQRHLICDHNGRLCLDDHNSNDIKKFPMKTFRMNTTGMLYPETFVPSTIVTLVGPPCSGKSTYIQHQRGFTIISRDDTLMEYGKLKYPDLNYSELFKALSTEDHEAVDKLVSEKFMEATKNRENIIIDMTNMSPKSRRKWSQGYKNIVSKEYWKQSVVFYTGFNTLLDRNDRRFEETGKNIPYKVFTSMCKNFKLPRYDEFDEIEYVF